MPLGIVQIVLLAVALGIYPRLSDAATERVTYSFAGGSDGAFPDAGLIADKNGTLYGTTIGGGASGSGAIFALKPPIVSGGAWTEAVLYSFTSGPDGGAPVAALVEDSRGTLYGTTPAGGTSGFGTVFELKPPIVSGGAWIETVLYSFTDRADGGVPFDRLLLGNHGALFGTAESGGFHDFDGFGVVFGLTPPSIPGGSWSEATLTAFEGDTDGSAPLGGLTMGKSGAVAFGTTAGANLANNCGTVFEISPPNKLHNSWSRTNIFTFPTSITVICYDGEFPSAGVVSDAGGNLYLTASESGPVVNGGVGSVVSLAPQGSSWVANRLYSFTGGADGGHPDADLTILRDGTLLSTTEQGGSMDFGTVFELTPPAMLGGSWSETVLHSFTGGSGGSYPLSNLLAFKGALYGTTQGGGASNMGTVFAVGP
jgi:uncharacterized repeat protein (TIGR03803 family)